MGFRTLQTPSEVPLLFQPAISDPRPMPTPSMYVSTKLPDGIDRSYCRANVASSKSVERDVRLMCEIEAKPRRENSPPETPKTVRSQGESAAETCIKGIQMRLRGVRSVREGVSSRILTRSCCCRWLSGKVLMADACKRSRIGGLHATGRSAREGREGVRVVWWLVRVGCSIPRP